MIIRSIACALVIFVHTPVLLLAQEVTTKAARSSKRSTDQQQQAMQRVKRCQEAITDAQNTAVGTSVLSTAVGFLPFGGAASGVASAAANVGVSAAGEIARQKAAAAVQGNC